MGIPTSFLQEGVHSNKTKQTKLQPFYLDFDENKSAAGSCTLERELKIKFC